MNRLEIPAELRVLVLDEILELVAVLVQDPTVA